jgi:hypothetical protein
MIMLADGNATKSLGRDQFWSIIVKDLNRLERGMYIPLHLLITKCALGVRIQIEGRSCLLICLSLLLLGDTPALKGMCGYSTSTSPAFYVRMPCGICEVLMENLSESIIGTSNTRSLSVLQEFFRCNQRKLGAPVAAWLVEAMKQYGLVRFCPLLGLHNQPSPMQQGIDSMHAVFLGVLKKHFIKLVKVLTEGDGSSKVTRSTVWRSISKEFSKYCRVNQISAYCNFSSKKEFKLRVLAGSMREFVRVSPDIVRQIGLVPTASPSLRPGAVYNWTKQVRFFSFWIVHVKIASLIEQHAFTVSEVGMLDRLIQKLLRHFYEDLPERFVTIKLHYYVHFVEQLRSNGSIRLSANNNREHIIQSVKPCFRNTNYKQKECSVFSRYLVGLFFRLRDYMNGKGGRMTER